MTEPRGGGSDTPQQPPAAPEALQQQLTADGEAAAPAVVPTTGPEGWAAHRRLWRRKRQRCSDSDEQAEGNGGPAGSAPLGRAQPGAIPLDATYEDLLGGPYRPFTQPIQLQEMVAFLQECWYDEGLYS
ncbi:hypothetical protein ABPG77_008700 [Micractinium sp. CCAP 211/92]